MQIYTYMRKTIDLSLTDFFLYYFFYYGITMSLLLQSRLVICLPVFRQIFFSLHFRRFRLEKNVFFKVLVFLNVTKFI